MKSEVWGKGWKGRRNTGKRNFVKRTSSKSRRNKVTTASFSYDSNDGIL